MTMATGTSSRPARPGRWPRLLRPGTQDDPLVVVRSSTWNYNSIGLWSGDEVLLVDPGLSPAELELTATRACTARRAGAPRRVAHLVLTHAHHDHLRGATAFPGARVWMPRIAARKPADARERILAAGERLSRRVRGEPGPLAWPTVDEEFEERARIRFGAGAELELWFLPGHSNCTSVAWLPAQRTLLSADYLVSPGVPFCRHEASLFEGALERLLALAAELPIERVVPAHGDLLEGEEAVREALLLDLGVFRAMRACAEGLEPALPAAEAQERVVAAAMAFRGRGAGLLSAQDEDNAERVLREVRAARA